jgi:hypothetical protein
MGVFSLVGEMKWEIANWGELRSSIPDKFSFYSVHITRMPKIRRTTMFRKSFALAGLVTGFVVLSPVAAFAGNNTQTETLSVSISGSSVTLHGTCSPATTRAEGAYGVERGHEPYNTGLMAMKGGKQTITFADVKAGNYIAFMFCVEPNEPTGSGDSTVKAFTMPAPQKPAKPVTKPEPVVQEQVAKKPQGAPDTGGGPVEEGSDVALLAAGGAAAAAGVGGLAFFALRRRRAGHTSR